MEGFLQMVLLFLIVLFSFFLILVIIYWGIVVLGMVEIDVFDFDVELVVDGVGQVEGFVVLLVKLKFNGVLVILVLILLFFFVWFFCYFVQLWLFSVLLFGWLCYLLGVVVVVGVLFLVVLLVVMLCWLLWLLFCKLESISSKLVLGQVVVVCSGWVIL